MTLPKNHLQTISFRHVRLRKSTKKKLSELGFRTLRGITRLTVIRFCENYIENLTIRDLGDIVRAIRKVNLSFKGKDSIFPWFLSADVVAKLWKRNIKTYRELTLMNRFELVCMLLDLKTGHIVSRAEYLENELDCRGFALRADSESLDQYVRPGGIPLREVINLYVRKIRTIEGITDNQIKPDYCSSPLGKLAPLNQVALYCHIMKRQKTTT